MVTLVDIFLGSWQSCLLIDSNLSIPAVVVTIKTTPRGTLAQLLQISLASGYWLVATTSRKGTRPLYGHDEFRHGKEPWTRATLGPTVPRAQCFPFKILTNLGSNLGLPEAENCLLILIRIIIFHPSGDCNSKIDN